MLIEPEDEAAEAPPQDAPLSEAEADALLAPYAARRLLIAVSGGPDSLALALLAARWRARSPGPALLAATVDHALRPASRLEAEATVAACAGFGLPCRLLVWKGDKPAARLQERARAERYRLLAQAARETGADAILTAHHADDQAETVLFRLLRGSGLAGLAGMAAQAPCPGAPELTLARPLLSVGKSRLAATLRAAGLTAIDDPSNRDPRYARARLRPLLAALAAEGATAERFARLAARARRAEEATQEAAEAAHARLAGPDGYDAARWLVLPTELRLRVLATIMRASGAAALRLDRLEALEARLSGAARDGRSAAFTLAGVAVRLADGRLRVAPAPPRRSAQAATDERSRQSNDPALRLVDRSLGKPRPRA